MNTVNVKLLFFGSLKIHFGNIQQLAVPRGFQLGTILDILKDSSPAASETLRVCSIAVDKEFRNIDYVIDQHCEVAILPPFSGG